jgi:uncharacterized membrane protein HdeD (DUF308 family)
LSATRSREVETISPRKPKNVVREDSMSTQSSIVDFRRHANWSIFMGVLTALFGVFLIAYPLATATIATVLLGWVLIFVAIARIVFALHSQTVGKFFLNLMALLYGIAGIALAFFPFHGVAALTILLGRLFMVYGVLETATAFEIRPQEGWGWFLFDAVVSFLVGIFILAKWPSSSVWAIGTLVGVAVLMGGISRIMIAAKIRSGISGAERVIRAA